jgi:hypothetical protein
VPANTVLAAAIAVAGEDDGLASDILLRAVRADHPDTADVSPGIRQKGFDSCVDDEVDLRLFRGAPQPIHEFRSGAAWQAMHATGGMAGIVEILDKRKRKAMAITEPFECWANRRDHGPDGIRIGLVMRFHADINSKLYFRISDLQGFLESCPSGRYEARGKGRRALREGIPFEDDNGCTRLSAATSPPAPAPTTTTSHVTPGSWLPLGLIVATESPDLLLDFK